MSDQEPKVKKVSQYLKTFTIEQLQQREPEITNALPKTWITTLFARFQSIWPNQWAAAYIDPTIYELAIEQWRISLYGISGEAIKNAINVAASELDFIPTIAQFKKLCLNHQNEETNVNINFYVRNLMHSTGWSEEEARDYYRKKGFRC